MNDAMARARKTWPDRIQWFCYDVFMDTIITETAVYPGKGRRSP
jgi:hypothetical protein